GGAEPPKPRAPKPEAMPEESAENTERESEDFGAWLQKRIDDVENDWKIECATAKVEYKPLGAKGKPLSKWQVCNGIVNVWIDRNVFLRSEVETDGKWDQRKAMRPVQGEWDSDAASQFDVMQDTNQYLDAKRDLGRREAGINLDAEPTEESVHEEVATP